jgi:hypothetical protein
MDTSIRAAAIAVMKITEVHAHPLSVRYAQPRWTAHERMKRSQFVLVEVRTWSALVRSRADRRSRSATWCGLLPM